jgi:hypothetical protein
MQIQPTEPMEHTAKAVLRGKFIAMSVYINRTERFQISDILLHLKLLDKQEQVKPKTSRRRWITKIRVEINEIETKNNRKNQQNKKPFLWKTKQGRKPPGKSD